MTTLKSVLIFVVASLSLSCGGGKDSPQQVSSLNPTAPTPTVSDPVSSSPPVTSPPIIQVPSVTFVGAGDIGWNKSGSGAGETGRLLHTELLGPLSFGFALGDNAYPDGTLRQYQDYFHPFWGGDKDKIFPVPGNHEYQTVGAKGYFDYFGSRAGLEALGYYSVQLGAWQMLALNSENITPSELQWLSTELRFNPSQCQIAMWHRPLFSSGASNGDFPPMMAFWDILLQNKVEVVLNGHDHDYERYAPQNQMGMFDPFGIREFVVGTGGAEFGAFRPTGDSAVRQTSEVRISGKFGLLKLVLSDGYYEWEFKDVSGNVLDSSKRVTSDGRVPCHPR